MFTRKALLAGLLLLGCLSAPALADDAKYFPDNSQVAFVADIAAMFKSKTFGEIKKKSPALAKVIQESSDENLDFGIPSDNILRIAGAGFLREKAESEGVVVITVNKPMSAADIKAIKRFSSFYKNVAWKEQKVGAATIMQLTYQVKGIDDDKLSPVVEGNAFCVVEEKTVIIGMPVSLRKVLERNKLPELSPIIQAALKEASPANALFLVVDVQALPPFDRHNPVRFFGGLIPDIVELVDKVQSLTLKLNEADKVTATASLVCKDAASASEIGKALDAGIVRLKGKLADDPKLPANERESAKKTRALLDTLRLATEGNRITATLAVDHTTVVSILRGLIESPDEGPPAKGVGHPSRERKRRPRASLAFTSPNRK